MAHFAQVKNNIVTAVHVIHDALVASAPEALAKKYGGTWIQTSYNANFRGKFAGIGDRYDPVSDTFQPPE